jgi:hypothetical protein
MAAPQEGLDLSARIFEDYQQAIAMATRRTELVEQLDQLSTSIVDGLDVVPAPEPQFFKVEGGIPEQMSLLPGQYFQRLATKAELNGAIIDLTASLSGVAVGRTVIVEPVDPEKTNILETHLSSGFTGSGRQEVYWLSPRRAVGTIAKVSPANNLLTIQPRRATRASLESGTYRVPVIGEDGAPLITIEEREPTFRDRPSRVGKILHAINFAG